MNKSSTLFPMNVDSREKKHNDISSHDKPWRFKKVLDKYISWAKKYENVLLFLIIIALSSVFRLTNLDLVEFKTDEASNLLLAIRAFFNHPLPYAGTATSVGILNPPFFIYLLIPLTLISADPKVLSFLIALVNVLSIGFLFLIIKKYYNKILAIITSLLIAFSPWAIILSRKIWPPDMVLPFVVLCIYSLHKIIVDKRTRFLIILTTALTLLPQLDMAYIFFSSFLIIFLILANNNISKKYIIIGFAIGLIPFLPYLIYELLNKCPDCFLVFNLNKKLAVTRSFEIFIRPLQIASQGNFRYIFGDDISIFANTFPLIYKLKTIFYAEYILIPLGLLWFWKDYKKFRFLVYAVIVTPLVYFAFHILPSMHYFAILIPFIFMFLGFSIYKLLSINRLSRYISYVLLFSLIIVSIIYNFSFFSLIKSKESLSGDYGTILGKTYPETKEQFSSYKNDKNFQEILISSYIPASVMYGPSSFAQMLYPYQDTKSNLKNLDLKLQQFPDNPIIIHELTAYYTANLTRSTIDILTEKVRDMPEYKSIYSYKVLDLYLSTNYKKLYKGNLLGFTFEYPEHWNLIENYKTNSVQISGDNYLLIITKNSNLSSLKIEKAKHKISSQTVFNQKITRMDCFIGDKYCGTSYSQFVINNEKYQIEFTKDQDKAKSNDIKNAVSIIDDITASLRIK